MSAAVIEALKALHTAAIDARVGYEQARDEAVGRDTRPLFQEMVTLHTRNADDLSHALQRSGAVPGEDGSVMGAVNRTVMALRSLLGGLGDGVVPALIEAETHNMSRYQHVLTSTPASPEIREVLEGNRDRLAAAVSRMRGLLG